MFVCVCGVVCICMLTAVLAVWIGCYTSPWCVFFIEGCVVVLDDDDDKYVCVYCVQVCTMCLLGFLLPAALWKKASRKKCACVWHDDFDGVLTMQDVDHAGMLTMQGFELHMHACLCVHVCCLLCTHEWCAELAFSIFPHPHTLLAFYWLLFLSTLLLVCLFVCLLHMHTHQTRFCVQ